MTDKQAARMRAIAARPPPSAAASEALTRVALGGLTFEGTIAGVWPLPGEIDIRPLLLALHSRGHRIVLPYTPPLGERLSFHVWAPGAPMLAGRFGTMHPAGEAAEPDMLLVPLLAFDGAGNRLGYGGGYYDRTLAALPGRLAVGFGYACQEIEAVPAEAHDRALDAVVTEQRVVRFKERPAHLI